MKSSRPRPDQEQPLQRLGLDHPSNSLGRTLWKFSSSDKNIDTYIEMCMI